MMVVAGVCLAVALVLSVIPGPAIPFFLIAGGLLALESRSIAKLMDGAEIVVRRALRWTVRAWDQRPWFARALVVAAGACGTAIVAYILYRLLRG